MRNEYQIVQEVMLTEKGTRQQEGANQYIFKVARDANKQQIKTAVEKLFNVNVTNVNTMNRKGKPKRLRSMAFGRTAGWKKAVVTLAEGSSIDLT